MKSSFRGLLVICTFSFASRADFWADERLLEALERWLLGLVSALLHVLKLRVYFLQMVDDKKDNYIFL